MIRDIMKNIREYREERNILREIRYKAYDLETAHYLDSVNPEHAYHSMVDSLDESIDKAREFNQKSRKRHIDTLPLERIISSSEDDFTLLHNLGYLKKD